MVEATNIKTLSLSEAGRRVGVSRTIVRKWINAGLLSAIEIPGGRPRVYEREIIALVERHTRKAKA
jgi:excisionase family DNA binding protein